MFQSIIKQKATSSNKLILGDAESSVAIVTLWSKAKEVAKKIDSSKYCVLGQLFSAERGLDLLIRNLIANPQISNLVITGTDFSKSGIVLEDFFKNGFEEGQTKLTKKDVWKVKSEYEGYIEKDVPKEALEELRESVIVTRTQAIENFDFSSLQKPGKVREKKIFEKKETDIKKYVGEYSAYTIRGKTVAEAWLKVLDTILKFGKESETHYDEPQREILNILSVIEEEDPNNFYIPDFLPCDREKVNSYIPRITKDIAGGVHKNEYTYGSRMRSWFGSDQVKRAVDKLSKKDISRAVVIGLWDSTKDLEIGGSPCLNHIWLRISDDKFYMTCVFRSHDMFEGYPENAFGLRALQEEIRAELQERLKKEIKLGELMILSQSAHIYKDTWEWADKITKDHLNKYTGLMSRLDSRGNFVINIENDELVLEHTSPGGEIIGKYKAKTGTGLRDILIKENVVSLVPHAIDLGLEIMKAEIAMKMGLSYNQDQNLSMKQENVGVVDKVSEPESQKQAQPQPNNSMVKVMDNKDVYIKDGIIQPDHQKKVYSKILDDAGINSMWAR